MIDLLGKRVRIGRTYIGLRYFLLLSFLFLLGQAAYPDDRIDVKIRVDGMMMDTIWVGYPSSFDFYIENDEIITALSLGFRFWSPDGATWTWQEGVQKVDIIFDPGSMSFLFDTTWSTLIFSNESRMYPPWDVFDFSYFDMNTFSPSGFDAVSPDTVLFGGVSQDPPYLEPGSEELMFSLLFEGGGISGDETKTLCIDSLKVEPYGDFVFTNESSETYPPMVGWPEGGKCWPVKRIPCVCCLSADYQGDADLDGAINVGDAVYLINYVFKSGPPPLSIYCGEVNGDGDLNVGDVVYLINYVFKSGPPPVYYIWP